MPSSKIPVMCDCPLWHARRLAHLVEQLHSAQARKKPAGINAFGLAPIQPGEPIWLATILCVDAISRDGVDRDVRRWRAVSLGPVSFLILARSRAPTTLEWRHGQAVADLEARGWLYQALARAWCAKRATLAPRHAGLGAWLERPAPVVVIDERRADRHCQVRQPASPGHCSDSSISTDRRPPDQLESGLKLARVTTI